LAQAQGIAAFAANGDRGSHAGAGRPARSGPASCSLWWEAGCWRSPSAGFSLSGSPRPRAGSST